LRKRLLQSVFSKYTEIQKVIIYGSRARGNFKASSDIDLTIFTDKKEISFLFVSWEINPINFRAVSKTAKSVSKIAKKKDFRFSKKSRNNCHVQDFG